MRVNASEIEHVSIYDARLRVMHTHEPVIDSAQAEVINNNNG